MTQQDLDGNDQHRQHLHEQSLEFKAGYESRDEEIAKLKHAINYIGDDYDDLDKKYDLLEEKNKKLKELLQELKNDYLEQILFECGHKHNTLEQHFIDKINEVIKHE